MEFIAKTLNLWGVLFIAFAALRVHHRVLNEHKIDAKVIKDMKKEQRVGIFGVILICAGYLLDFYS